MLQLLQSDAPSLSVDDGRGAVSDDRELWSVLRFRRRPAALATISYESVPLIDAITAFVYVPDHRSTNARRA